MTSSAVPGDDMREPGRSRSRAAIALGVALLGSAWLSGVATVWLAQAAASDHLYNGPGMIAAVAANAVIALALLVAAIWFIARGPVLGARPGQTGLAIASGILGPVGAFTLYFINCLLKC